MAQYYKLNRGDGMSSLSVDGIEHQVDPDTGNLVVDVMTPNLGRELKQLNAVLLKDNDPSGGSDSLTNGQAVGGAIPLTAQEKTEREGLFIQIDTLTGKTTDRRRSLQQLRKMMADLQPARPPPPGGAPHA